MTTSSKKVTTSKAGAAPAPASARAPAPAPSPAPSPASAAVGDALPTAAGPVLSQSTDTAVASGGADTLLGSSLLSALIKIGDEEVQLGTVVAGAHEASGLSVADWNALGNDEREQMLAAHVTALTEAAQARADEERAADAERADAEARRLEAQALEQQAEANREAAKAQARAEDEDFPCVIEVGNNSGIALTEPVSGAYIQAGGTGRITLLSFDHAHQVQENLQAMLDLNYLDHGVLVITKLPK